MNALFCRFHNFILPLVRGADGVCACTCGRHQVYHVVSYNGAQPMMDSSENYVVSDIMARQEMNLIVGLLLGLCISLFLQWLLGVCHSRLKYWISNQINDGDFWSWMPKFSKTTELFRQLHPKHTEDFGGNMLHLDQDVHHDVNDLSR
ncbi:transmembrane protein 240-like [Sander lucioperca]|uniref:transmembrane protein 240-like n=1 Tax=Sander lucioperca TaxID=283035 RepID=UPI00125E8963|nr:transmembrane protein 240-like [Sander lucioperca]XP_031143492.1 transmembrane protein 240-like [Sander lucioperca]XP_031143493.1 transmembrane protein 240-like [Sander lucioperca]XP_031143494.1 transmembrane protein 240-like [Sander lucioperca]XP_031143495.1 transmembrane protein 240-like [Sander lucioperca]XP_035858520.1 transmembrane protein 240-like [Sander lucioperca]